MLSRLLGFRDTHRVQVLDRFRALLPDAPRYSAPQAAVPMEHRWQLRKPMTFAEWEQRYGRKAS